VSGSRRLDRETLRRLTGRPEQVVGAELLTLGEGTERGVRVVRLRTGEIEAEVVVDRALDVARASVRGLPVAWLSPTGVAAPWFAEPEGWGPFRTFFGGLLTTCGLDHTLAPVEDDASQYAYPGRPTQAYPLHGRVSATPARLRGHGLDLDRDPPVVYVEGDVRQAQVFGEHLVLERRIEADLGGRELRVRDRVRNEGYAPTPHLLLYHCNAGWPLVAPGARVVAPVGDPRVATPAAEGRDWSRVGEPVAGAVEQVWEHTPRAGHAALLNDDVGDGRAAGLEVAWDLAALPRLFEWKVENEGHYVVGLEPGNLELEGRLAARAAGRLPWLEPGEARAYELTLRLLWGPEELAAAEARCV
jgi:hypothetical protein